MKNTNKMVHLNFFIPTALLQELDGIKEIAGLQRSTIFRLALRNYIDAIKQDLLDKEKAELEAYHLRYANKKRQVTTGLLPDF